MFNLGFDKKIVYVVLGIFLISNLLSGGTDKIIYLLLTLPAIFIALTFHEFAHAYTAYKLGDQTPKIQGRLNLNPFTHIDPIGFTFLLIAGFGWGKAVQINPRNFSSKYSLSKAEAIVAAAGPIANFITAILFVIIYYAIQLILFKFNIELNQIWQIVISIVQITATINVALGIFNLIPLPPLDGSKILMHFLKPNAKQWFYNNQTIFYIIFLAIFITGASSYIIKPLFDIVYGIIDWAIYNIFMLF